MTMLEFFQTFQTAMVGVIGFSGVIIAQIVNGNLARKRDEEHRRHQRIAIMEAILAELKVISDSLSRNLKMDPPTPGEFFVMGRIERKVSGPLARDLGLLGPALTEETLIALLAIDEYDRSLHLVAYDFGGEHFKCRAEAWPETSKMAEGVLVPIDAGIRSLEKELATA